MEEISWTYAAIMLDNWDQGYFKVIKETFDIVIRYCLLFLVKEIMETDIKSSLENVFQPVFENVKKQP